MNHRYSSPHQLTLYPDQPLPGDVVLSVAGRQKGKTCWSTLPGKLKALSAASDKRESTMVLCPFR